MIQIQNISSQAISISTMHNETHALPMYFNLAPNDIQVITKSQLRTYPSGTQQDIAEYVSKGMLLVSEVGVRTHLYPDQSYLFTTDFEMLRWQGATALPGALLAAPDLQTTINKHVENVSFHTIAGAASAVAVPTDLLTLAAFLTSLRTFYNSHIAALVQHPFPDTFNAVPIPALVTLQECISAIRSLVHNFGSHQKTYFITSVLPANLIIGYT